MITIFNRKELLVTMDLEEFARARDILAQNRIEYACRVNDITAHNWGHSSQLGINRNFACLYYIYVREKDYEDASYLIYKKC